MDSINSFFNDLFNGITEKSGNRKDYNNLNEDEKIVDIWSDVENDPLLESVQRDFGKPYPHVYNESELLTEEIRKPMPRMISLSGHTYVNLNDTLCDYEKISSQLDNNETKILTAKKYLKKEWKQNLNRDVDKNIKYLEFVNQTYFSHIKERIKFAWIALKAVFYLVLNALFPNWLTYSGTDKIIILSELILDKYSDVLNKRAEKCLT